MDEMSHTLGIRKKVKSSSILHCPNRRGLTLSENRFTEKQNPVQVETVDKSEMIGSILMVDEWVENVHIYSR